MARRVVYLAYGLLHKIQVYYLMVEVIQYILIRINISKTKPRFNYKIKMRLLTGSIQFTEISLIMTLTFASGISFLIFWQVRMYGPQH